MKKKMRPIIILFMIVNAIAVVFAKKLEAKGVNYEVIIWGNLVIFIATMGSAYLHTQAIASKSPQAIMRGVYGGFMLKFFVLIAATLVYVATANPINKPALFTCMGLYLVYHFLGTANVLTQKKTTTDGEGKTPL